MAKTKFKLTRSRMQDQAFVTQMRNQLECDIATLQNVYGGAVAIDVSDTSQLTTYELNRLHSIGAKACRKALTQLLIYTHQHGNVEDVYIIMKVVHMARSVYHSN